MLLHLRAMAAARRLLVLAAHRFLVVLVALKTQETAKVAATLLAALNTSKLGGEDVKVLRRFAC